MNRQSLATAVYTIQPQGSINAANAEAFKQQLVDDIAGTTAPNLLIDMHQVEFLDSAGLMALVAGYRLAQSLGRSMSLCCVSSPVRILFELTQLDGALSIFETRADFEASLA
ncbi:MAG: STAS domain-containing protein [Jaaginema sp. PMC 1079.18]|nr:STAS domain-containing protein [Jaaginema sp. PMC 1080.18]MEC4853032.1 STAS domain-containing protein [Jaaginema sp. PMC 1079.18]MEC4868573.1 STAS domain-containing protein [Jaaginema sp. PMC 1078.18]